MEFFTSDTHFFHENLLGLNDFAPRPFANVDEMNQTIIDNWNEVVSPKDTVYHLGDITILHTNPEKISLEKTLAILNQLNGNLVLIKGNHDSRSLFKFLDKNNYMINGKPKFAFHDVGTIIKFNHRQFYLTHYPMMLGIVKQIINLHGHIHHYDVPIKENINVGIDSPEVDFIKDKPKFGAPLSTSQIEEIVDGKDIDFKKRR